jgi:hypothetical protein
MVVKGLLGWSVVAIVSRVVGLGLVVLFLFLVFML